MADKPVSQDAADGFLPADIAFLFCKRVNGTQIGLLNTKDDAVTFDRRTAS